MKQQIKSLTLLLQYYSVIYFIGKAQFYTVLFPYQLLYLFLRECFIYLEYINILLMFMSWFQSHNYLFL